MYIDFRCFFLVRNSDCSFEVKKIGKWYFGVNVWLRRIFGGFENDGNFVMFSDIWLDIVFWQGKYLYYICGVDYCKSMGQYMWGLLCVFGEVWYLNWIFVMDLDVCLFLEYSVVYKDELGKDFCYYFDLEYFVNVIFIIEKYSFEELFLKWNVFIEWYVFNYEI